MGQPRLDPLSEVNFWCRLCGHRFIDAPERTEDAEDQPWHPWRYFAACPDCGSECEQVNWERGLLKAHASATGPKTAEGKAAAAGNLAGHPTPEEAKRTRFNALKHGSFAETAKYFPARPGRYPHCETCEWLNNGCDEDAKPADNPPACLKRTELFMQHQIAFESGDPNLLTQMRANTQAALQAIIDDMILAVTAQGVTLHSPEWWVDPKAGKQGIVDYEDPSTGERKIVWKTEAHPLLKPLLDYIARNKMTLEDLGMTPKVQDDNEILRGQLDQEQVQKEDLLEYQSRQADALEGLQGMIERSRQRSEQDPVYLEHKAADGDEEDG